MATWKDDLKYAGRSVLFYLMLAVLVICWITAITLTILEVTFWVIIGLYLLGAVLFFTINYLSQEEEEEEGQEKKEEEKDKREETTKEPEEEASSS